MATSNAEVQKAVTILVGLKGDKEVQQGLDKTYDKSHENNEQLSRDSKRSGENVEGFMRKWKFQLLAVGTALGALWGIAKFSPVAASMVTMVGTALGYLASIILMPLLPLVLWLTVEIIKLADWFSKLPEPIRLTAAAILGLAGMWALLKGLGLVDLAKKLVFNPAKWLWDKLVTFLAGWNAMLAAGGLAGGIAFAAAVGVGIAAGLLAVGILIKSGVIDWIYGIGRSFEEIHPVISDVLKFVMADLGKLGAIALRTGSAIMALVKGIVSGNWTDWSAESSNYIEGLKSDFAEIDQQRQDAVHRLNRRAAGEQVDPYVRPELTNPTPLNLDVWKWIGLTNPTGTGAGMAGTTAAGLPGGISQEYADQVRSQARAAGVPEEAISQVLENMGGIIDTKGQAWNATMGTNLDAAGTTLTDKSSAWSSAVGTSTTAATTALTTGTAGWAPTVSGATGEVNTSLQTAGLGWGDIIINALWSGLQAAIKSLPGTGVLQALLSGGAGGIPSHATGGRVARTGLALMHEGDWVRSSFGDTTRTGTGGSVQNSGGGGGFTIQGDLNIYSQATDAAGIKRDILRELGTMVGRR